MTAEKQRNWLGKSTAAEPQSPEAARVSGCGGHHRAVWYGNISLSLACLFLQPEHGFILPRVTLCMSAAMLSPSPLDFGSGFVFVHGFPCGHSKSICSTLKFLAILSRHCRPSSDCQRHAPQCVWLRQWSVL